MLQFLADENFNGPLLRAVRNRDPTFTSVTVQELGIQGIDDPSLLPLVAAQAWVVLSHDVATLVGFASQRLDAALPMRGIIEVRCVGSFSAVVEDLMIVAAWEAADIDGQTWFVPLR